LLRSCKPAVRKLTGEILTLQAEGSYDKAKAMLDRYGLIRPDMRRALDRLSQVPIDIEPRFTLSERVPVARSGAGEQVKTRR
jgi:hypothetical protein